MPYSGVLALHQEDLFVFGTLAEKFEISRPAVSQHLKVLRDAGIVTSRPDAQRRIYRLSDDGLDTVDRWLKDVRKFWSGRLDRLDLALSQDRHEEEKTDE